MSSLSGNQNVGTVDGSTGLTSFSLGTANLGTLVSATPLRIVAQIATLTKGSTLSSVTSITDSEGLTWHKAGAADTHSPGITEPSGSLTGAPLTERVEIWYTDNFANTDIVAPTVYQLTVHVDNDIDSMAIYYACHRRIDPTHPLDLNASNPAVDTVMSSSSSTASVTMTTDTATLQVCVIYAATGPGQRPGGSGQPIVDGVTNSDYGSNDAFHLNQNYIIFGNGVYDRTSALTAATISTHDATDNQILLVVAFTEDSQTGSATGTFDVTEAPDVFTAQGTIQGHMAVTEFTDNLFMFGFAPSDGTFDTTDGQDTWATAQGFEALAIENPDNSAGGGGIYTYSTNGPNRIIVICQGTSSVGTQELQPIDTITSTSGLVFQRGSGFLGGQDTSSLDNFLSEIWWAHAPRKLTNEIITINYVFGHSSTNLSAIFAIKGLNGNFADPFDRINPFAYGAASGSMISGTSHPSVTRPVANGPLSSGGSASDFAIFDPAQNNNVHLESGDLTVTSIGTNDPLNWASPSHLAGRGQNTGNVYLEATFDHIAGSKYGFGILHIDSNWGAAGLVASGIGGIWLRGDGTIWAAGSQVGSLGVTPADGDVIGMLVNPEWARVWFKDITQNSYWNDDPTAVPGFVTDSSAHGGLLASTFELVHDPGGLWRGQLLGGLILPFASPGGIAGSPHASITMNFGGSAFVGDSPGNASGWGFVTPAVPPTHVHYPNVVVGIQLSVQDTGPAVPLSAPPGYTNISFQSHQGSQRYATMNVYAQVRGDNILTTDNDLMIAPDAISHWSVLYTTFAGASAPGFWGSLENTDQMVFVGHQFPGVRGDLTAFGTSDTFAAIGFTADTGTMFLRESADIFSAYGFQPLHGTFDTTETPDRFAAAGIGRGEDGVFITVEATDIFAAIGAVPPSGIWNSTENTDVFRAIGAGVTQVTRRRRRFVT